MDRYENNGNNNKFKRNNKRNRGTMLSKRIAQTTSLLGSGVNKIVQFDETISSVSGTATPVWTTSADNGIYIYPRFSAATDFTEMAAAYQRCRIMKIRITVNRTYTSVTGISVYPAGVPPLRIGFFPGLTPTINNTDIIDLESAAIVAPYAVNPVIKEFPIPNLSALNGAGTYLINMSQPFDTNAFASLTPRGVFGCGWKSNGNATSDTVLYDVRFQFLCRFDIPY